MSNALSLFESAVPAHISAMFGVTKNDDLTQGVGVGFAVFSIRGSKWRIVKGGEETLIRIPGTDDAAPAIEVVFLKANPSLSKVYYAAAYVEGSDAAPDCFSNEGIVPDASVEKPQCATCAACPQNVWGSKISPSGSKIKACADVRRLACAPAGDLSEPILLRVPGASLGDLAKYGSDLSKQGVSYSAVVTKLAFDADAAYPKLTYKPVRYLTAEESALVLETMKSGVVDSIVALSVATGTGSATPPPEAPAKQTAAAKDDKVTPAPRKKAGAAAAAAAEAKAEATAPEQPADEDSESEAGLPPEQAARLDSILAALD